MKYFKEILKEKEKKQIKFLTVFYIFMKAVLKLSLNVQLTNILRVFVNGTILNIFSLRLWVHIFK